MAAKVRVLLSLAAVLIAMSLSGCGHYTCGATFGNATCTPSGGGISGPGGGTTNSAVAFAYYVDQAGTMDGFSIDTTAGTFSIIPNYIAPVIPTSDLSIGVAVAQKKFLYTAFFSTEQIYGWSIDSNGQLTAVTGSPYSVGYLGGVGFTGYNQLNIITNPAGTLLFIADAGNAAIYVYTIGSDGSLTAATGSPLLTGSFQPWNMATDGLGKYLYVTNVDSLHEGFDIAAYTIGSDGSLTTIPGSPFSFPMWAVAGDPSGKYLIGTTGQTIAAGASSDDDHLYVFNIQQTGTSAGAISPVTNSPFATVYAPFNIAVQPNSSNGEFVYSFSPVDSNVNAGYNPVEAYAIDTATGQLTTAANSPFSGLTPAIWGQFDQSGAYLFNYADISGPQLGVYGVASGTGALTQPYSPIPMTFTGYWAVTDPQ
jgi:6-phosphogluconolactonase (cycloisomerase 2 family)